jgi:ADP-ribose pyrophosphatase
VWFPEQAGVVAQTPDGRIIVERQYKHGIGRASLMLPGGALGDDEDALFAAQRELLEETGYVADEWKSLGSLVENANQGGATLHLFSAKNAHQVRRPESGDLEDIEILLMRPAEMIHAIHHGEVVVLGVVAAIALALDPVLASEAI